MTERRTSIWAARWQTTSGRARSNASAIAACVGDVALDQDGARLEGPGEVLALPAGEVVDHEDLVAAGDQRVHHVRADEPGAACDQRSHRRSLVTPRDP